MKKVLMVLMAAVLVALPSFVDAGYGGIGTNLLTRLEVSKDNATWVNYLAETNSGNQTLTVSPGDTLYFRLKTWNIGNNPASDIEFSATYTNPQYISALDPFSLTGAQNDLDGDVDNVYSLNAPPSGGTMTFNLNAVAKNTTDLAGFESGGVLLKVAAGTPDQTVILATVTITGIRVLGWWKDLLFPRAYADDAATTQVRIMVSNPPAVTPVVLPATGADSSSLLILPVAYLYR